MGCDLKPRFCKIFDEKKCLECEEGHPVEITGDGVICLEKEEEEEKKETNYTKKEDFTNYVPKGLCDPVICNLCDNSTITCLSCNIKKRFLFRTN